MQGHQEYKQRLGTHSEPIYTVSLFQKSFLGKLNKFVIGGIQKRRAVAHSKRVRTRIFSSSLLRGQNKSETYLGPRLTVRHNGSCVTIRCCRMP